MTNTVKVSRRGRPPVNISWPDVVFTAQDIVDTTVSKVSRVTIHSKLNKAVDSGELDVVGMTKTSNGRPRVKYCKAEPQDLSTPLQRGFTLVEIMIVVAIIGILAAVAIPSLINARKEAQVSACRSNLHAMEGAITQWAMKRHKADDSEVSLQDIKLLLKSGVPKCPAGGEYELFTVQDRPTCTLIGHTIDPEEQKMHDQGDADAGE